MPQVELVPTVPHERLEAYHRAIEAAVLLDRRAASIPATRADLRDQLNRAAASIVLNLAEGASELSAPEKARFYRMSRRSAGECLAILDLADALHGKSDATAAAHEATKRVSLMLTRLLESLGRRRARGA